MLWSLIIGLVIGAVAKLLMPGKDPGGWIITMIIGVIGSALAHFIGVQAGWYAPDQPAGFFASVFGAVLLLIIYRLFQGKSLKA